MGSYEKWDAFKADLFRRTCLPNRFYSRLFLVLGKIQTSKPGLEGGGIFNEIEYASLWKVTVPLIPDGSRFTNSIEEATKSIMKRISSIFAGYAKVPEEIPVQYGQV